jgi:hypothetical protein
MQRNPLAAATFKQLRNSGEAYRQFRTMGVLAGVHEMVIDLMRRKLVGGAILVMGTAGFIGILVTFWPR